MDHRDAFAGIKESRKPASSMEITLGVSPLPADATARVDETGVELKRGAFLNTIGMLASNFRGIFTFLVARLLGPAALGIFSVAWSTSVSTMQSSHLLRARRLSATGCEVGGCFEWPSS